MELEIVYAPTPAQWRKWLEKNHDSQQAVWLVFHTKASGKKSLTWSEAVDEALCFGWIDSKKIKIDHETSHQFFSKRKAKSTWSKINKDKVVVLIEKGLMQPAGLKAIEIAQQNGWWTLLDEAEQLIIPEDLERAFERVPNAKDFFLSRSKSDKKNMLQWLVLARLPETRKKRIVEIVECSVQNKKPKHLQ